MQATRATVASDAAGDPAATSTAAGPSANHALLGTRPRRLSGSRPRATSTSCAAAKTHTTAGATSAGGRANVIGTKASCVGTV